MYNKQIFQRCFCYKGRYWYRNILAIPSYFKQLHFLVKHGYDSSAQWDTFSWFIDVMTPILIEYQKNHQGYPIILNDLNLNDTNSKEQDKQLKDNEKAWKDIVLRMIDLLKLMDESNPIYTPEYDMTTLEQYEKDFKLQDESKDEFFKLFSKYFWHFWD